MNMKIYLIRFSLFLFLPLISGSHSAPDSNREFITIWQTHKRHELITLPLIPDGIYNFSVDWGDGTSDTVTSFEKNVAHIYRFPGIFRIAINGTIIGWQFGNDRENAERLIEIVQWGPLSLGDTKEQFRYCENMTISAKDIPDLTSTTDLSKMFYNCKKLKKIPSLNKWDVSGIVSMEKMFAYAEHFNQNLSDWDVSNVENMEGMFRGVRLFNRNISRWNTSKVATMAEMFSGAEAFNQDISNWDTSSVRDMSFMFSDTDCFNQNLSLWDTSHVVKMDSMFSHAESFNGYEHDVLQSGVV